MERLISKEVNKILMMVSSYSMAKRMKMRSRVRKTSKMVVNRSSTLNISWMISRKMSKKISTAWWLIFKLNNKTNINKTSSSNRCITNNSSKWWKCSKWASSPKRRRPRKVRWPWQGSHQWWVSKEMAPLESSVWARIGLWQLLPIKSSRDNVKLLTRSAMMMRTKTPTNSKVSVSLDRGRLILRNVRRQQSPDNSLNLSSVVRIRLSANTKTIFLLTRRLPTEELDHQEAKTTSFSSNLRCLPASVCKDNQVIAREKLAVIPENKGILAAFMVLLSLCNLLGRWYQCWSQRNRAAKLR